MSIEIPQNWPEEIGNVEEIENTLEMSPEDFAEMIDQLPILKEMLQERKTRLSESEKDLNASAQETEAIRVEIEELQQEISEREELLGE